MRYKTLGRSALKLDEVEALSATTELPKLYPQWMVERMNAGR